MEWTVSTFGSIVQIGNRLLLSAIMGGGELNSARFLSCERCIVQAISRSGPRMLPSTNLRLPSTFLLHAVLLTRVHPKTKTRQYVISTASRKKLPKTLLLFLPFSRFYGLHPYYDDSIRLGGNTQKKRLITSAKSLFIEPFVRASSERVRSHLATSHLWTSTPATHHYIRPRYYQHRLNSINDLARLIKSDSTLFQLQLLLPSSPSRPPWQSDLGLLPLRPYQTIQPYLLCSV